jgi:hypothetical protein
VVAAARADADVVADAAARVPRRTTTTPRRSALGRRAAHARTFFDIEAAESSAESSSDEEVVDLTREDSDSDPFTSDEEFMELYVRPGQQKRVIDLTVSSDNDCDADSVSDGPDDHAAGPDNEPADAGSTVDACGEGVCLIGLHLFGNSCYVCSATTQ